MGQFYWAVLPHPSLRPCETCSHSPGGRRFESPSPIGRGVGVRANTFKRTHYPPGSSASVCIGQHALVRRCGPALRAHSRKPRRFEGPSRCYTGLGEGVDAQGRAPTVGALEATPGAVAELRVRRFKPGPCAADCCGSAGDNAGVLARCGADFDAAVAQCTAGVSSARRPERWPLRGRCRAHSSAVIACRRCWICCSVNGLICARAWPCSVRIARRPS